MTVRELIEKLEHMPMSAPVLVRVVHDHGADVSTLFDLEVIRHSSDGDVVIELECE